MNPLFANGFKIGSVKYFTIKADDRSVYGKQVRFPNLFTLDGGGSSEG